MPRNPELGSLTKEPPVERLDATLDLLRPGMTYREWQQLAATAPAHPDAPGLLKKRYLSVSRNGQIEYDGLFALLTTHGPRDPRVRKIMYFIWAMRDSRIRHFILNAIADKTGRWQPANIADKANSRFFSGAGARKARSNYEKYLELIGVYDPAQGQVNLSLEDGWLTDAMSILAARETDVVVRERMVRDPVGFLISQGLHALANIPVESRPENHDGELENWDALDDRRLPDIGTGEAETGNDWQPRDTSAFRQRVPSRSLDLVSLERATKAHQSLERVTARAIRDAGRFPKQTRLIDLYAEGEGGTALLEIKSCNTGNIRSQVRKGVGQLLEYRWRYRKALKQPVTLALVLETAPAGQNQWLIDYLADLNICCAWKHPADERLITSSAIPATLTGMIFPTGGG